MPATEYLLNGSSGGRGLKSRESGLSTRRAIQGAKRPQSQKHFVGDECRLNGIDGSPASVINVSAMASRDTEWVVAGGSVSGPPPRFALTSGVSDRQGVARVRVGCRQPRHLWRRHDSCRRQVSAALSWVVVRVPRRAGRQVLPGAGCSVRQDVIAMSTAGVVVS
jgi:hypothetical protein